MNELKWTRNEKIIARRAFERCYEKECVALFVFARLLKEG